MTKIIISLLTFALQMLGAFFDSKAYEINLSSTSKFFFAYNQDGNVIWKIPISKDFIIHSYAWNTRFAVANCKNKIKLFEISLGKLLWCKSFDVELQSVGLSGDSVLAFADRKVFFLASKDGSIFAIKKSRHPYEIPIPLNWSSAYHQAIQLTICQTSKFVIAYDNDASLLWKQPIAGYRLLGTTADLFFLASNDSVKVFSKHKGNLIWKRGFIPAIRHVVIGARTQVFLINGNIFIFESSTGNLINYNK